jgi:competence protein ComEA
MRIFSSILVSSGLALAALTASAGPVDINTADAATLARELNGVGPARAQAIVAYRNEHGPFKSVDDLRLVKNMPQKVIDSNRELLRMDGGKAPRTDGRAGGGTEVKAGGGKAETKPDGKPARKP